MDLTLRDLRAFVSVADSGSFTRAAEKLHLSQPALTVQIRRLEAATGARLFDRNSRNVSLTPTGRDLLPMLRKSLQDMENVLRDARSVAEGRSGTVRIACLPTFAASALPDLLVASRRDTPHATFQIFDGVAETVNALVRGGDADIGLTGGDLMDPTLEVLHTGFDRLVLVCPKHHPLSKKRRITLEDVASSPLVLTAPNTSVRAVVDAALIKSSRPVEVACEPTYMMTAVAMVRGGLGVTILPSSAREVHAEPGLVVKPIDHPAFVRPIAIVKQKGRTLPAITQAFVDLMKKSLERRTS